MFAISLRSLAYNSASVFNAAIEGHENNAMCLATAINELSSVLFALTAPTPEEVELSVQESQTEFVRVNYVGG